jgi:hypothetical protein
MNVMKNNAAIGNSKKETHLVNETVKAVTK